MFITVRAQVLWPARRSPPFPPPQTQNTQRPLKKYPLTMDDEEVQALVVDNGSGMCKVIEKLTSNSGTGG